MTTTPVAEQSEPGTGKKIPFTGLPTENPNSTVVPGKMRSDREEIPEGYTKEDADKAEIAEARILAAAKARTSNARGGVSPTNVVAATSPTDCINYWPALQYYVCGEIRVKYDSLGGPSSFLLFPTTNELVNPDGFGRRSLFQNGPIYWSAATGAHPVVNHFHQKWGQYGYEAGWLGYPKTDEVVLNGGRLQDFQGATIYWSPLTGAHPVGGAIRDKWAQTGWEGGPLGYPTTDEIWVGANGEGRMNRFQNGVIYWSPTTGAHPVTGRILDVWTAAGYEQSEYGYPKSDVDVVVGEPGAKIQLFQRGSIYLAANLTIRAVSELLSPSGGFKSYDTGVHPNYCQLPDPGNYPACPVDNSEWGTSPAAGDSGARLANLNEHQGVKGFFNLKGYSTANSLYDNYYDNTGADYILSASVIDAWTVDDQNDYGIDSPKEIVDGVRMIGVAGAISEADKAGKAVKVIYDFPWTTVAGIQNEHVLSLGRYSIAPTIAVIAQPGSPGNHQLQWRVQTHMYDVYDYAKPAGEYGELSAAAVQVSYDGNRLGVAKNFLVFGSGSVQSGSGVG